MGLREKIEAENLNGYTEVNKTLKPYNPDPVRFVTLLQNTACWSQNFQSCQPTKRLCDSSLICPVSDEKPCVATES